MLLVLQHHLEETYRFQGGSCPTRANVWGKCPMGQVSGGQISRGKSPKGPDVLRGRMSGGRCPWDICPKGADILHGECPGADVHGAGVLRGKSPGVQVRGADDQGTSVLIPSPQCFLLYQREKSSFYETLL